MSIVSYLRHVCQAWFLKDGSAQEAGRTRGFVGVLRRRVPVAIDGLGSGEREIAPVGRRSRRICPPGGVARAARVGHSPASLLAVKAWRRGVRAAQPPVQSEEWPLDKHLRRARTARQTSWNEEVALRSEGTAMRRERGLQFGKAPASPMLSGNTCPGLAHPPPVNGDSEIPTNWALHRIPDQSRKNLPRLCP